MNKDIIFGFARHLLTTSGGGLVAKGLVTTATLDTLVGSVMTIVGIVWSILSKKQTSTSS